MRIFGHPAIESAPFFKYHVRCSLSHNKSLTDSLAMFILVFCYEYHQRCRLFVLNQSQNKNISHLHLPVLYLVRLSALHGCNTGYQIILRRWNKTYTFVFLPVFAIINKCMYFIHTS